MSMVGFPLLLIPLAIYNIIVFLMPGVSFADPLVKLTVDVGRRVAADAERYPSRARYSVAAVRGHQGRASRLQISHRSSAVVDRVRRCGCRIPAVAAVRHLGLFPADAARAGGFPVGHCAARAAWNAGDVRRRGCEARGQPAPAAARQAPQFEPRPTGAGRAGSGIGRRIRLLDHPEPTPRIPKSSHVPSPEVSSPGLQPGEGSPPPRDVPPH